MFDKEFFFSYSIFICLQDAKNHTRDKKVIDCLRKEEGLFCVFFSILKVFHFTTPHGNNNQGAEEINQHILQHLKCVNLLFSQQLHYIFCTAKGS